MRPIIRFTSLGFDMNALLDEGKAAEIGKVHKRLADGSLLTWLEETFGSQTSLSLYGPEDRAAVVELFASLSNAVDSRRKFGVQHNGLALLAAYCFEGIQQLQPLS